MKPIASGSRHDHLANFRSECDPGLLARGEFQFRNPLEDR